jgi:D-cysteine desulfhydrase
MKTSIKLLNLFKLETYNAPKWLKINLNEKLIPKIKLNLNLNEIQIEKLDNLNLVFNQNCLKNYKIYLQRDDLNHNLNLISGNKIRKLEFLLADAIEKNCKHIITVGGIQSNHCRAVAILANMLKIKAHLFLRSQTDNQNELSNNGNLLLSRIYGASIYLIEQKAQYLSDIKYKMEILEKKLLNYSKESSYLVPVGGSNTLGLFGYFNAFESLITKHNLADFIDDIIVTSGSGGTMSSLAIANLLTGSKFKIHSFNICDSSKYFYGHLDQQLKDLGLGQYKAVDLVNIVDGYKGAGYGVSRNEELEMIIKIARETSVLFDPVYTGKAFIGFINALVNSNELFKGKRLLFIHTGGIFSHFDGRLDAIFKQKPSKLSSPIYNCFYENINNINF